MNFQMPTDEAIPRAFEQGEAAVLALFHEVAAHVPIASGGTFHKWRKVVDSLRHAWTPLGMTETPL